MLGKLKDAFDKSVAAVSVKSESLVESSRIRTAIGTLQKSLDEAMAALGRSVYTSWANGNVDHAALEEACQKIKKMNLEISSLQSKLEQIKEEEAQILGAQKSAPEAETGAFFCTNCGKKLEAGSMFCDECGTKVKP